MMKKGFTLVEVVLMIMIIGILAGIVWAALNPSEIFNLINTSRQDNNLKALDQAFEHYALDNQNQAPEILALSNNQPYLIVNGAGTYNSPMDCNQVVGDINTTTISSLIPGYLATVPVHDSVSDPGDEGSGYYVMRKGSEIRVGSCFGDYDFDNGLVALWHMDDAAWASVSNEVVDSSGNNYHAQSYPNSSNHPNTITDAKVGSRAGRFDGVDDYVRKAAAADQLVLPNAWTISVWIRFHDISSIDGWRQGIVYKSGGTNFYLWYRTFYNTASNRIYMGFKDEDNVNFHDHTVLWKPSDLSKWYHFVYTFDNATDKIVLYINGVAVINNTETHNPLAASSQTLSFGQESNYFDGDLDEITIWNRALSQAEINTLYALQN